MSMVDSLPTVLVVDDEVRSQDAMRRTLDEDFTVLTASDADEARARLERHEVSMILCDQLTRDGLFREDLYHRIGGVSITVPPLRERAGDIAPIARRLVSEVGIDLGRPGATLSDEPMACLMGYPWPGNIRELRNEITRAVALSDEDDVQAQTFSSRVLHSQAGLTATSHAPGHPFHETPKFAGIPIGLPTDMPKAWFVALASLSKSATRRRVKLNVVADHLVVTPMTRKTRLK